MKVNKGRKESESSKQSSYSSSKTFWQFSYSKARNNIAESEFIDKENIVPNINRMPLSNS
jgi:hypothetical protein